ncbi:ferritin-like domain-containing protein [Sphingobacterium pedocola]|uniref:DUF2383 domain-containing protein n=1 Tax=Sphingobacterium pedocola TaxID=2082722 RepID=A0ABR9TCL2_9SPHI|nr:PA2169 family four-helix-bundle protein [Sphingobacterium pedocola]MBE8723090.1 hypothetical protein [Sphingobacterium pedocola]
MENRTEKTTEVLNDLIEINNDRIEGYAKAIELLDPAGDIDLNSLFEKYRQQSQQFKSELTPLVFKEGETPEEGTRVTGKLFRTWMDIKNTLAGNDRKSILESCERGEDAFKRVYENAWTDADGLDAEVLSIIRSQAELQLAAHDEIKALRDEAR